MMTLIKTLCVSINIYISLCSVTLFFSVEQISSNFVHILKAISKHVSLLKFTTV